MSARRKITIITPAYNEAENVEACCREVRDVMERRLPHLDYEHIFADNASTDRTVETLRSLAAADRRIKVIVNSRNVGPFRNTFNAMRSATGDAVVVMLAADLQDPPAVIADFVQRWEQGYPIVYGVRHTRQEPLWMRSVRKLYYRLVALMADISIPTDAGEFQLIDRVVVDAILRVDDSYPYIRGLIAQTGMRSIGVEYTWAARLRGISKNRFFNLVDQGLNGLISTSKVPMRISFLIGMSVAVLSVLYAIGQLVVNLAYEGLAPPGIPSLIVGLFFFGGVQLLFIGILGEYVLSIHAHLRRGPPLIELERINLDEARGAQDGRVR
jgi:glycosyltransferase involved in cell wall biosynthesis